jgi:hypothetical protein
MLQLHFFSLLGLAYSIKQILNNLITHLWKMHIC